MNKLYEKHKNHEIDIIEGPFNFEYTGKTPLSLLAKTLNHDIAASHPGKIVCKTCKNKYIKWASKYEIMTYKTIHKPKMTFGEYLKTTDNYLHSTSENDSANIFLVVTFQEKDKVKKYGATWDPYHKLWYTTVRRQNADKLIPWMMPDDVKKLNDYLKRQTK